MSGSPTSRTKVLFEKANYLVGIVEKWITIPSYPGKGKRRDLYGIIDVLAIKEEETIGIQCCATSGLANHVKKLTVEKKEESIKWLTGGTRKLEIWSWRKLQPLAGKKRPRWEPRVYKILLKDLIK